MFDSLAGEGINIEMISTSPIRISCVISGRRRRARRAGRAPAVRPRRHRLHARHPDRVSTCRRSPRCRRRRACPPAPRRRRRLTASRTRRPSPRLRRCSWRSRSRWPSRSAASPSSRGPAAAAGARAGSFESRRFGYCVACAPSGWTAAAADGCRDAARPLLRAGRRGHDHGDGGAAHAGAGSRAVRAVRAGLRRGRGRDHGRVAIPLTVDGVEGVAFDVRLDGADGADPLAGGAVRP